MYKTKNLSKYEKQTMNAVKAINQAVFNTAEKSVNNKLKDYKFYNPPGVIYK